MLGLEGKTLTSDECGRRLNVMFNALLALFCHEMLEFYFLVYTLCINLISFGLCEVRGES